MVNLENTRFIIFSLNELRTNEQNQLVPLSRKEATAFLYETACLKEDALCLSTVCELYKQGKENCLHQLFRVPRTL